MSVHGFNESDFAERLNEVVSPSRPIRSVEYLYGREEYLETIKRALYQSGRHIFIYGDRGVGKSSLGATAALQYQSSDAKPIFVSGSIDDSFKTVIANIANLALGRSRTEDTKSTKNIGIEWRGLKWGGGVVISAIDIASQIQSVGDAADLLREIASKHSQKPIVVLDEFDAIQSVEERNKFASLLKQLGDQSINIKFIFTGIGKTLDELLGSHLSAYRQLETIELPRLSWEGRRGIVVKAAQAFSLDIDDNVNWRIAMVSDGYPYYVQLITEKMLWEAFDDEEKVEKVTSKHYQMGLRRAISSINAELKRPYEQAVVHRDDIYETVVWATADGDNLDRDGKDMYLSFTNLQNKRHSTPNLITQPEFSEYLRKLKKSAYGEILVSIEKHIGWYTYKEKMLRGYVRMQAEASGIELRGETELPRQQMRISSNVRTGLHSSSVPRGIKLRDDK